MELVDLHKKKGGGGVSERKRKEKEKKEKKKEKRAYKILKSTRAANSGGNVPERPL